MLRLVSEQIDAYSEEHTTQVGPLLHELRDETHRSMSSPQMQVGRVEGTFLKLLVQLSGARRVVELGMFTGYSALLMAEGLPEDGELITCDIDPRAEAMARRYFDRSPHGKKIQIRMGPALETLKALKGPVDLAFIDADKTSYPAYYEALVPLLKPGGLLVADNVLWSGKVVQPADQQDADTRALVAFAAKVRQDPRVEHVLLTVRDGMLLVRKK